MHSFSVLIFFFLWCKVMFKTNLYTRHTCYRYTFNINEICLNKSSEILLKTMVCQAVIGKRRVVLEVLMKLKSYHVLYGYVLIMQHVQNLTVLKNFIVISGVCKSHVIIFHLNYMKGLLSYVRINWIDVILGLIVIYF